MISSEQNDKGAGWSLNQLLYKTIDMDAIAYAAQSYHVMRYTLLVAFLYPLIYPITHRILLKVSETYKSFGSSKQVVVIHHTIEMVLLTCLLPSFTYFIFRLHFKVYGQDEYETFIGDMRNMFIHMYFLLFIYFHEISTRYENPNPLITIHHLLATGNATLTIFLSSNVMVKTASVFAYFICFENISFAGLVLYRLCPSHPITPKVIMAGIIFFGTTRPFQLLWVIGALFWSWNDENNVKWEAVFQFIFVIILTVLQFYSVKIHISLHAKCIEIMKKNTKSDDVDATQDTGCISNTQVSSEPVSAPHHALTFATTFSTGAEKDDENPEVFDDDLYSEC